MYCDEKFLILTVSHRDGAASTLFYFMITYGIFAVISSFFGDKRTRRSLSLDFVVANTDRQQQYGAGTAKKTAQTLK